MILAQDVLDALVQLRLGPLLQNLGLARGEIDVGYVQSEQPVAHCTADPARLTGECREDALRARAGLTVLVLVRRPPWRPGRTWSS